MTLLSIAIGFVVFVLLCILHFHRKWKLINIIPGPPGVPIFGNVFNFIVPRNDLWKVVRDMNDNYYPIYKIWSMKWAAINLRHPDDVEVLLTSHKLITKSIVYDFLHPWFGTGLLTSTGEKWQHRRKILTPAFHFNVLRQFVSVFDEEGQRIVHDLRNAEGSNVYNLLPLITKYTLNTICETAMGHKSLDTSSTYQKYRKAVHDLGEYMIHRLLRPWIHSNFLFNLSPTGRKQKKALAILHGFTNEIIRERQQYHKDTGGIYLKEDNDTTMIRSSAKTRLAMLDLLIEAMKQGNIDEAGIREEVDTFMFEGHDTSAMGIIFTLLLLAEHKDIQQRARDEIDAVLEKSDGRMNITSIQQLTYLERCIKEALRLYPSVPFISRSIDEDMHLEKYIVPKGTLCHIHIFDLHRDPNFWPDPLTFNPDRFLPERLAGRHPFSYIPFSAGQRNCIGQKFAMLELKAFVGHLLHNFFLEPIDCASKVRLLPDLVLRPVDPIHIKFVPR